MADFNFDEIRRDLVPAGTWGNATIGQGSFTFAGATSGAIGARVAICKVPGNCTVVGFLYAAADMGTGVTFAIGTAPKDKGAGDPDAFVAALDVATAASSGALSFTPVEVTEDSYVTVTVAGAAATGRLDLMPIYRYDNK